jgi:hypothetical protein
MFFSRARQQILFCIDDKNYLRIRNFGKSQCWQPNRNPKFTKNLTEKNPVFSGFSKINFHIKNTEFLLTFPPVASTGKSAKWDFLF